MGVRAVNEVRGVKLDNTEAVDKARVESFLRSFIDAVKRGGWDATKINLIATGLMEKLGDDASAAQHFPGWNKATRSAALHDVSKIADELILQLGPEKQSGWGGEGASFSLNRKA
jgi:hypothetical protein